MSELDDVWTALISEARTEPGWHSRRVLLSAPCSIRAAVRPGGGLRGLLFEVAAAALPAGVDYPACAGFILTPETMAPGPGGRVRLILEERGAGYADLFSALAHDVTGRAAAAASETAFVTALLSRLQVWMRFAARFGPGLLSEHARAGLAGELLFLEAHVLDRLPAPSAVAAWTGPTGTAQDFRFQGCYVEIKSTTSASPSTMRISNLDQLDGAAGLPLFLCHLALSAAGPLARSLPEIVAALRLRLAAIPDGSSEAFDDLLVEAGYLDAQAAHYLSPVYAVRRTLFHAVDEGFPRLTPSIVPAGVSGAVYILSLAACQPWIVDGAACTDLIGARSDV